MKIILTGATGFVGRELLGQLLEHPGVTGVTALSRRPVEGAHARLRVVRHDDFSVYEPALMEELADHGACLWALGGKASDFASLAEAERVTHGFTLAFASAMAATGRPLAFGYLSGMGADPEASARLPWERDTRVLKGRTEADLTELGARRPGLALTCFRPGGILPRTASPWATRLLGRLVVRVDALARVMIRVGLGRGPTGVLTNGVISAMARG